MIAAPVLPIVAAFTVCAITVPVNVPVAPAIAAPVLPIVAAFTVVAVTVAVVTEVANAPVAPVIAAPVLPIVAAFTVCAITVPVNVPVAPLKAALALPIVAAFTALALIVVTVSVPATVNPVSVPSDVTLGCAAVLNVPVNTAPLLPIVAAFTVVAVTVGVVTEVANVPVAPVNTAPVLPIVAAFTKVANIVPVVAPIEVKLPSLTLAKPELLMFWILPPVLVVANASNAESDSTQTQAVFTEPYVPKLAKFLLTIIPMSYPLKLPEYPLLKTTKGSLM